MDRGRGAPSRGQRITPAQRKAALRIQHIDQHRDALINALAAFADRQGFADDWFSADGDAMNRIGAVERHYEQVINALRELFDIYEHEAEQQKWPNLRSEGQPGGRWARMASPPLGYISSALAGRICDLEDARHDFQHDYADLHPLKGADVWDLCHELIGEVSHLLGSFGKWKRDLWP